MKEAYMKEKRGYPIGREIRLTNVEVRGKLMRQIQEDTQIPDKMREVLLFVLPTCRSITVCNVHITNDSLIRDIKPIARYGEEARHISFAISPYQDADDYCHMSSYSGIFCRKSDYESLCQHYTCDNLQGKTLMAFLVTDSFTHAFLAIC